MTIQQKYIVRRTHYLHPWLHHNQGTFMLQMAFIIKLQVVGKALFAIDRYIHIPY